MPASDILETFYNILETMSGSLEVSSMSPLLIHECV